ncbi:Spo0B domain-containing protein [Gorillibacterium sp. CAU 1737]|uniref:Spo0B domain-containing protein n=1 Tax=Gorillibacterium sp. CAU 1737 TaxID=3140362 RepID=UPI0032612D7C
MNKGKMLTAVLVGGMALAVGLPTLAARLAAGFATVIAVGWLAFFEGKSEQKRQDERLLRVLSIYRHDWMNHIQVLMGYIRLGKYERLADYVGKINGQVYQESYLAKMGVPELAVYYYEFRSDRHSLELEFELDQEIALNRLPDRGTRAARLIREAVELFARQNPEASGETGSLSLAFDSEEAGLLLDFVYRGTLRTDAHEQMDAILKAYQRDGLQAEQEWSEEGATIAIRLPFSGEMRR